MKLFTYTALTFCLIAPCAGAQTATGPSAVFDGAKFETTIGNERRILIPPGDNPFVTVHILNIGQNVVYATWDRGAPFDDWHHDVAIPPGGSVAVTTDELAVQNTASNTPPLANHLGWIVYKIEP